jgi:16S rRNA (cytosine967-C5)-methyltransferase
MTYGKTRRPPLREVRSIPAAEEFERRDERGRERSQARLRDAGHRTTSKPSQRRSVSDPARQLAFEVLAEVAQADAYANLILPPRLRRRHIVGRDAGFATELTYGTLRMQGRYDAILAHCTKTSLTELDPLVVIALRLGAHQLLGMRVPAHAAVSETVALAKANIGIGPAQFVNAVLRRVGESSLEEWLDQLNASAKNPTVALAETESHPLWVVRAFKEALTYFGRGPDELPALLEADNLAPKVTLVLRPELATDGDLVAENSDESALDPEQVRIGQLAPTARILESGDPFALAAVREGRVGIQDEGSQWVTLALANAPLGNQPGPVLLPKTLADWDNAANLAATGERWLDMCAGPGGKAALLGALAAQRGATLFANEISEHRAKLVVDSLKAIPAHAIEQVRVGDGRDLCELEPNAFDRVLLDAPCSGLGALRRRPESRWRRTPADIATLRQLQVELLNTALQVVKPGGIVAYVTCSPHIAETATVVSDVLKKRDNCEVVASRQLWPHVEGTDAMHLSLIRRLDDTQ